MWKQPNPLPQVQHTVKLLDIYPFKRSSIYHLQELSNKYTPFDSCFHLGQFRLYRVMLVCVMTVTRDAFIYISIIFHAIVNTDTCLETVEISTIFIWG